MKANLSMENAMEMEYSIKMDVNLLDSSRMINLKAQPSSLQTMDRPIMDNGSRI
jgi:hypothetical protein